MGEYMAHRMESEPASMRREQRGSWQLSVVMLCLAALEMQPRPAVARPGQQQQADHALSRSADGDKSGPLRLRFAPIEREAGEDPPFSLNIVNRYRGQVLEGMYTVCVLSDGSVSSVRVKQGVPGIDEVVVGTLKTWRYSPQPRGTLTCTTEVLSFEF